MNKLYPAVVSLMGGLGLGLALTYFVGVGLTFHPEMERWEDFFIPRAIALLLPPYVLLMAHMVLRNHVGRYFLNRRAYDEAIAYASRRCKVSVVRSAREVANHRLIWARGLIGKGQYEEAEKLLTKRMRLLPKTYALEARRLLVELALRADDREEARALLAEKEKDKARGVHYAALLAAEAELALRDGEIPEYRDRMLEAMWADATSPRVGMSRALAMIDALDEADEAGRADLLRTLEMLIEPLGKELPARESEIKALCAQVLHSQGKVAEARERLKEAQNGASDFWSNEVLANTVALLG